MKTKGYPSLTNQELWVEFVERHDCQAFAQLINRNKAKILLAVVGKVSRSNIFISLDFAQDAFQSLKAEWLINPPKPKDVKKPIAYIVSAVCYKALNKLKKDAKYKTLDTEKQAKVVDINGFDGESEAEKTREKEIMALAFLKDVKEGIAQIKSDFVQKSLSLNVFKDMDYREIALLEGVKPKKVADAISRGKASLRKSLSNKGWKPNQNIG